MDIAQLKTFDCIVREGNFSRAAWKLDLTQPTVSARVQALEAEIGAPLFVRGGRTLDLTPAGESFLPYVRRVLALLHEGMEITRRTASGETGRITLGVIESLSGGFLVEAMSEFQQAHAGIEFYARSGHSEDVAEMLRTRRVQLGLMLEPHRWSDLQPLLWFTEPIVLAAGPTNLLTTQESVTLADVSQHGQPVSVVPWNYSQLPQRISQLVGATSSVPISTAHSLLRRGRGVAFLSREQIADDLAQGHLVEIAVQDLPAMHRHFALVRMASDEMLPPFARLFVETLRRKAGTLFDQHS